MCMCHQLVDCHVYTHSQNWYLNRKYLDATHLMGFSDSAFPVMSFVRYSLQHGHIPGGD